MTVITTKKLQSMYMPAYEDLVQYMVKVDALLDELVDDHGTYKTAVDELNTLTDELRADHATFKSAVDETKTVLGDVALSAAGLAIGTAANTSVKIANTVTYLIDGVFKSKTTAEKAFTTTTHDIADGSYAIFLVSLQADGTVTLTKGADDAAITTITPPAGECVIGHVKITMSGSAFTAGTTALDDANATVVYTDTSFLPQQITAAPATITAAEATAGPAAITAAKPSATHTWSDINY